MAWIMAFALGCGGRSWTGQYEGNRDLAVPQGANPALIRTMGMVRLDLRPDGTFTLIEGGNPMTGDYTTSGDEATLRVKTFMDRPIAAMGSAAEAMKRPVTLRRQADGSIELRNPSAFEGARVTIRRIVPTPGDK
ncbi:MAG TPA: hypothetical protein PLH94_09765 [Fimbriimonadaceae bacterium]|nr:hypothetical protein [Fimbriimonadaceae bacterium]